METRISWTGRELEWINDHGLKMDDNGIIQIPRAKWARMQYTDESLRHPGKHTLMIPSDFGCCLLTEGMHFEIIG